MVQETGYVTEAFGGQHIEGGLNIWTNSQGGRAIYIQDSATASTVVGEHCPSECENKWISLLY